MENPPFSSPNEKANRLFPTQRVQAPRTRAGGREIEEDPAVENGRCALVHDGPEALGRVKLEIRHRHFARQDEGDGSGEKSEEDQGTAEGLEHAADPDL